MREQLKDKRLFAVMGVISRQGSNAEADNDIALPVPLRLDACYGIVKFVYAMIDSERSVGEYRGCLQHRCQGNRTAKLTQPLHRGAPCPKTRYRYMPLTPMAECPLD